MSKKTLKKWIESKSVYLTSLGYYFDEPSDPEYDHKILLRQNRRIPFEFASLSADVHRELFAIYQKSLITPDPELAYYRHESKLIQDANDLSRKLTVLITQGIRAADSPPERKQAFALQDEHERLIQLPEGDDKVKAMQDLLQRTRQTVRH